MLTLLLCGLLLLDIFMVSFCANTEKPFWGLALLLGGAYLTSVLVGTPVVPFVRDNWTSFPLWFGGYVLLGVPWAFAKWYRYALVARKKLKEWLVKNPVPVQGDNTQSEFAENCRRFAIHVPGPIKLDWTTGKFQLLASEHKGRITTWLAFWPFSIIGTAFDDLFLRLWENVYEACSTAFQRISDKVLADVNK